MKATMGELLEIPELRAMVNDLARSFYRIEGCEVRDGFDFFESRHPQERRVLALAQTCIVWAVSTYRKLPPGVSLKASQPEPTGDGR